MRTIEAMRERRRALGCALLIAVGSVFSSVSVHAHFILVSPDSWMSQDSYGLPEKLGPCGDEGGGTLTGEVTPFQPGQAIAVTIDEVIFHPGHYRVALAVNDRSELPPEPDVMPIAGDPCGSAAIQDHPMLPILADNVLPHTEPFAAPQTFTVTLPAGVTCSKCTLQVLEFMSDHGSPCFYHHCADLSIQDATVSTTSTTEPTGATVSTTTTTMRPCPTPRCAVAAVVEGPACSADHIPAAVRRKLDRVPVLLEQAEISFPGKAKILRKTAKRLLQRAGRQALEASRSRKLSVGCATAIKRTADQIGAPL